MTYTAGFNAGVEAAAELAKAKDAEAKGYGDAHHVLRALPEQIRALKRPGPSEDLRVERLAAWLADRYSFVEWSHSSEGERQYWRESARAALKAMEGE